MNKFQQLNRFEFSSEKINIISINPYYKYTVNKDKIFEIIKNYEQEIKELFEKIERNTELAKEYIELEKKKLKWYQKKSSVNTNIIIDSEIGDKIKNREDFIKSYNKFLDSRKAEQVYVLDYITSEGSHPNSWNIPTISIPYNDNYETVYTVKLSFDRYNQIIEKDFNSHEEALEFIKNNFDIKLLKGVYDE